MTTPMIDRSSEGIARRRAAVDQRMNSISATGDARAKARREIEQDVEREEIASLRANAELSEATAERARVASIVRVGTDMNRPRQALRLALAGPVDADQARSILGTLPLDQDAPDAALSLPMAATIGGEAAQTERQRIATVFTHPAAQGRFRAAAALALDSETAIPVDAIASVLTGLPVEQDLRIPTLEERAEGMAEFGDDGGHSVAPTKGQKVAEGWSKAVADANRAVGAGGDAPQPNGQHLDMSEDPSFGLASQAPGGGARP